MFSLKKVEKNYEEWIKSPFDSKTINSVKKLRKNNLKNFQDSFYKDLSFGTGGMRGIMGEGPNRVNKYSFGKNTQGISNYINDNQKNDKKSVVIAYDSRHNSKSLAEIVANVFSANGIKVFLFSSLRPTPVLSYALTKLKCTCGIVLTASHNPPEYNGYKVYWSDGGQIVPPLDKKLIFEINKVKYSDINFQKQKKLIDIIDKKIDDSFVLDSIKNAKIGNSNRVNFKIVFTSIHGTSNVIGPRVLREAGYSNLLVVKEQSIPDGNFSTVKSPNPEEEDSLKMAKDLAVKNDSDMFIGTDPDADRLGVGIKIDLKKYYILNGNELMVILTNFLLSKKKLNRSCFIASTIVSTPILKKMANVFKVKYKESLTGFKWIGKMIKDYPKNQFIGGGEESYGYLVGNFVRDKDAITSSLLACELGSECKEKNETIFNYLIDCYIKFGFYKEKLISIEKRGISGQNEINDIMQKLRKSNVQHLAGNKIKYVYDYKTSIKTNLVSRKKSKLKLPKSDVLIFESENGTRVAIRPSGTEPKIKFYFSVNTKLIEREDYFKKNIMLENKINELTSQFNF